jgi:hypothetical protein
MTDLVVPLIEPAPPSQDDHKFTIYDKASGRPLMHYQGPSPEIQGDQSVHSFVRGHHSLIGCVVDHATKVVSKITPTHDSPDLVWDEKMDSFVPSQKVQNAMRAQVQIDALERQQNRALRDRELGSMTLLEYRQRLQNIEEEIIVLRAIINS